MFVSYVRKIPPSISVPAFYVLMMLMLVLRFLFGSVYGALALVMVFYAFTYHFTSTPPLSPSELVLWIDGLTSEYKVALLTSSVTVLGFVVAFHTATANWKDQMGAQFKAQVAGEIESFFAAVTSSMNIASLYVESLVSTVNKIQKGANADELSFLIQHIQGQVGKYLSVRDQLSQASIEVHRLIGRSHNVLSTGWGLPATVNLAAESLANVTDKMWFHVPIVDLQSPNHIQSFLNQVNISGCNEFLQAHNDNSEKISGLAGGIRGYLISPILGFSLPMFTNLLSDRKQFRETMERLHIQLRNKD